MLELDSSIDLVGVPPREGRALRPAGEPIFNTPEVFEKSAGLDGPEWSINRWGHLEHQRAMHKMAVAAMEAGTFYDVGCGTGCFTDHLPAARQQDYTGIDSVPGMIERARRSRPGWRFQVGAIEELLPLSVDGAVATGVLAGETVWLLPLILQACRHWAVVDLDVTDEHLHLRGRLLQFEVGFPGWTWAVEAIGRDENRTVLKYTRTTARNWARAILEFSLK